MLDPAEIAHAARLLRSGRLVAFPTETVYGLGANALDAEAVARIYAVKRRPPTSPLIVHVASIEMAQSLVEHWPDNAAHLANKFWPGPLTLVLRTRAERGATTANIATDAVVPLAERTGTSPSNTIPPIVTAGLPSIGVRMPAHPVAQALIAAAGVPIAAPSANRFAELSPTTAEHVRKSLGHDVDYILDGGACSVGIESTVISLAEAQPVLLRPGAVARAEIEAVTGPLAAQEITPEIESGAHPSPGMHPRHYSPRTELQLVENGRLPKQGRGVYLKHQHPPSREVKIYQMPQSARAYAAALYEALHLADAAGHDWIAIDMPPAGAEWEAIHDRLTRAATKK